MDETQEGWYTDPYARHEARWMSAGVPTVLVRDGAVEGHDPAPDEPFSVTPVRIGLSANAGSADLQRADDAERQGPFDPERAVDVAETTFIRGANKFLG